jgi:hypothetical protein
VYGRIYDPAIGRSDVAHLVVWRRCFPDKPIPKGMTVDHLYTVTRCQRPDHLPGPVTRAENTRRQRQRTRATQRSSAPEKACAAFAVAVFKRCDRPTVEQRTVSVDELVTMLNTVDALGDKRQARGWSPTRYADGHTSRSNAGVASVTCLVFDCDRVPLDPERLAGVCWIGHTTWSHRPDRPKCVERRLDLP